MPLTPLSIWHHKSVTLIVAETVTKAITEKADNPWNGEEYL